MRFFAIFFFLCFLDTSWTWAKGKVEIYVDGTRYESMDAYKTSKKQSKKPLTQEEKAFKAAADHAGVEFNPKKIKTILIEPHISRATSQKLQAAGFQGGVQRVITDFTQNWDNPNPKFKIESLELEDRLRAVAGDRQEAVIVISDPRKLRVMAFTPDRPESGRDPVFP